MVQGVSDYCSAVHPQGRQPQSWSRRHGGIEAAVLVIPRADSLSLRHGGIEAAASSSATLSVSKADPLSFRLVMVVERSME